MSYTELQSKVIKKTRKPHQCEWCGTAIEKGSTAHFRAYVHAGDFNSGYTHEECWDAMSDSDGRELEEGWTPGDFKRGKTIEESMAL